MMPNVTRILQGHAAPRNVQPIMLNRSGRTRTNHSQFIPYMSKDVTDHAPVYHAAKKLLHDVFDWLAEKVCVPVDHDL